MVEIRELATEEDKRVLRRGLNRDKLIHVGRFSSSENFVYERGITLIKLGMDNRGSDVLAVLKSR